MAKFIPDNEFNSMLGSSPGGFGNVKILYFPTAEQTQTTSFAQRVQNIPQNIAASFQDPNNPVAGFVKGAATTLSTAPRRIAEIPETASNIALSKSISSSIQQLTDSANRMTEQYIRLPLDDPQRLKLRGAIKDTNDLINQLSSQSPTSATPKSEALFKPLEPVGLGQKIGYAGERIGEFLAAGGAVKPLETAVKAQTAASQLPQFAQRALNVVGRSAAEGVVAGTIRAAQGGTLTESAKTAGIAGLVSVPFKALSEYQDAVAQALQTSAEKSASQALGATTKRNKELTDKVVPELLNKKVMYGSREGLASKAAKEAAKSADDLTTAYEALPADAQVNATPIIKNLENAKQALMIKGTQVVPDAALPTYKAITDMQLELLSFAKGAGVESVTGEVLAEPTISVESARSFRQLLDTITQKTGKSFALTGTETAKLFAQKSMANSIRDELAQEYPSIAKVNAEFNFWKNVETVVNSTIQRTKGQAVPLGEKIAEGAGAVTGAVSGGGLPTTIGGAAAYRTFVKVVTSPAFRQASAILKNDLANALAAGNAQRAIDILNRIAVAGGSQAVSEKKTISDQDFEAMLQQSGGQYKIVGQQTTPANNPASQNGQINNLIRIYNETDSMDAKRFLLNYINVLAGFDVSASR